MLHVSQYHVLYNHQFLHSKLYIEILNYIAVHM